MQTTYCLQLGAEQRRRQALGSPVGAGRLLLLGEGLQPVPGQVPAAGAEGVVEGGREAGDVSGDVGKNLWRRLVVVTDLGRGG